MKKIFPLAAVILILFLSTDTHADYVDPATGFFMHSKTDLRIPGVIPVNITRQYNSRESGSAAAPLQVGLGVFGKGAYLEYDWWLGAYGADGNINNYNPTMFLLVKPGNFQYRFDVKQADGTFINDSDPEMAGAVVKKNTDLTRVLKMRDGWKYTFDATARLIEVADRNGNKLTFERHSDFEGGSLKKITTAEGMTVTFNQTWITDIFFRIDSIRDSAGRTVSYTYEDDPFSLYPRLKKVLYPDGGSIEYRYDSQGRMSEIINERGIREVMNEYDTNNRVYRQTRADGSIYTYSYTEAGGNITETSMTGPNGAVTTWRFYDDAGNFYDKYIVKKTTPDGITIYERELGTNRLLSVTDPLGRKTTYTYYPDGQIQTIEDSLHNITRYQYEPLYGMTTKITDANGKDTTFTYTFDSSNRLTKTEIRDPLQHLTTTNYNSYGLPTSITDPNNNTTTFLYENTGKPAELTKIIGPAPVNSTTVMTYDDLGRLETVTDANGKTTQYSYDEHDRIIEVKDPLDGITRYSYGKTGNLLSVTDAKNQTIRYEYDERDRIKKMIDQLGREEVYTYYTGSEITLTTGDNLKSILDRKGQLTTFNEYDAMNRVKKITYHDGTYIEYTYDAAGRVDYVNDSVSGFIDYAYNDFGCTSCSGRGMDRIAQEITPLGTIDYTYDNVGRRKTMQVAGQTIVNYDYYDNGWIENIRQIVNGIEQRFNFVYDDAGRRTFQKYFKGTDINPIMQTAYSYDNSNRLLNIEHLDSISQVLESIGYTYDANGNRISMNRPSVTLPFPNAVSNTAYNDANQMLSFNDKNITYDNNGNMTSVTNSCGLTNYTWDVRNRLIGINGFNTDCSPLTASFKYDILNKRIEKTINGVTTKYLYDGLDIIQELNVDGTVKANYIRGLNIDEPLMRVKADGTMRLYKMNALGSIIALTDDSGVVKTTYSYDPFGNTTASGESSDNPFQYTGRENDGTGLYYYRARYYSPELQRFVQADPIGIEGTNHLYLYAENDPINKIDPLGLFTYNKPEPKTGRLSGEALNLANCMEGCIGKSFVVTGGSECTPDGRHVPGGAKGSKHCTNQAFDMRPGGMDKKKVFCCARKCGAKYIKNEGDHWHFQTTKGKNGSCGLLPQNDCECN